MSGPLPLFVTAVAGEQDVFLLRRVGRIIAGMVDLDRQDQIRLATALSELGRDRMACAGVTVRFVLAAEPAPALEVTIRWADGPAPGREALLSAERLVRDFSRESRGAGGTMVLRHLVSVPSSRFAEVADRARVELRSGDLASRTDDSWAQTQDLIAALEEARAHGEGLRRLNEELEQTSTGVMALYAELSSELEQTNSGVVALHAELDDKSRRLREAGEAKTRFWRNVSHELRSPLNSVIGLSRLLEEASQRELGPEQRRQVASIAASGETLRTLVDELLDFARAESGQLEPELAPVELGLLIAELAAVMRPSASNPAVDLVFPDPAGLPTVVTDETMLTRVLRNLVGNSLKFTESGHVRVEVLVVAGEGDALRIVVEDTGVGIPLEDQAGVFEEFYQVRGAQQRGRVGTGLGLPYARRLMELLGGTIDLTSEPGLGTRVVVSLPAVQSGKASTPPVRLPVIISADDDPAFSEVLRPMLSAIADRVVQVADGSEILEAARREQASAIVVDLDMPGTDGYEVLRLLAADSDLAAVPVAVVTGFPAESVDRVRLGHARAILAKDTVTAGDVARALGVSRLDQTESL